MLTKTVIIGLMILFLATGIIYASNPNAYWIAKTKSVFISDAQARTQYGGYVELEPVDLTKLSDDLSINGCIRISGPIENPPPKCHWSRMTIGPKLDSKGGDTVVIYPNGLGWGPSSFEVTTDKMLFGKDLNGKPNLSKLKEAVRKDAAAAGLTLKESSWHLKSVRYPWNVLY